MAREEPERDTGRSLYVGVRLLPMEVAGRESMDEAERLIGLERPFRAEEMDDVETILEEESWMWILSSGAFLRL